MTPGDALLGLVTMVGCLVLVGLVKAALDGLRGWLTARSRQARLRGEGRWFG